MTLSRRTIGMPGPRKFLIVGNWDFQKDCCSREIGESIECGDGSFSAFLSYARQHLPVEIGTFEENKEEVLLDNSKDIPTCTKVDNCHWLMLNSAAFDAHLRQKMVEAKQSDVKVIACLCETTEERASGRTEEVLFGQMKSIAASITDWSRVVIAFEALWASGTGVLATPAQVQEALANIRQWLRVNVSDKVANTTRIIYAGSVSSSNCREMAQLEDLDGFLVGSSTPKSQVIDIFTSSRMSRSSLWVTHQNVKSTQRLIEQLRDQETQRKICAMTRCPKRYI